MQNVWISEESCIGCRQCINACPHHCLSIMRQSTNRSGIHPAYLRAPQRCSGCEICVRTCPVQAIDGYSI